MSDIRINIIGGSGSGTSTLGQSLAAELSVVHFECDDYFHAPSDPPFQSPRSPAERYELIRRDVRPDESWVLSGGIAGWSPQPQLAFTHVVFLYVATPVRIERLRRRERDRFGDRILDGGDMHANHEAFIDWASRYDAGDIEGKTLAVHEEYLTAQSCPVLKFHGEHTVSELTRSVITALRDPNDD